MAMTYEEVLRRLGRRDSVQVDKRRGTEIRWAPGEAGTHGDLQVRYRGTAVVTLHPDHTYTLRTGGTASKTVIRRIAEYSPISLVRRGNGFFIEDVQHGQLLPFLEGTTVDAHGKLVTAPSDLTFASRGPESDGTPIALDEDKLRAFVRQIVQETLTEHIQPNASRGVRVRIKAEKRLHQEEPSPSVGLDVVEKLLLDTLPADKAQKTIRDLRNSLTRGRKTKLHVVDDGPAAAMLEAPSTPNARLSATCDTCKLPLVAHYDGANRYRGCDYALKHVGEART